MTSPSVSTRADYGQFPDYLMSVGISSGAPAEGVHAARQMAKFPTRGGSISDGIARRMYGTVNRGSVSSELADMIVHGMRPSAASRPMQSISAPPESGGMFYQDYGFQQQMLDPSALTYSMASRPSLRVVIPQHRGTVAQMV